MEEEYKKLGKTYSPFLLYTPEELYKKIDDTTKSENFDYYKRHILLENYDEEPESYTELTQKISKLKENNIEKKAFGETKWFDHNGNQLLKKCELNYYDPETKLFHISIIPSENSNNIINKKVTRFNFIFDKTDHKEILRRIQLAEKWREKAKKYLAMDHFVKSFEIGKTPELITEGFIDKILMLVFLYKATPKTQMTPVEHEGLDNKMRFGIWRRHVRKRQIEIDKFRLEKVLKTKKFDYRIFEEIKDFYLESFNKVEFYLRLPINYDLFLLLKDVIPKEKFLLACEKFLYPTQVKGTLQFLRSKGYLDVWVDVDHKLHQSEKDLYSLLLDLNKKFIDDFKEMFFFYTKWRFKPIRIKDFLKKNEENIETMYKELKYIVSHSNFVIIKYLENRKAEAKKFNKDAE